MGACLITRNSNNEATRVVLESNPKETSKLFNELSTIPLLDNKVALHTYMQAKSINQDTLVKNDQNEALLFFNNGNGLLYRNYGDALKNAISNQIQIGVVDTEDILYTTDNNLHKVSNNSLSILQKESGDEYRLNDQNSFIKLVQVNPALVGTSTDSFINQKIKEGVLAGNMVLKDNRFLLQPAGSNHIIQTLNAQYLLKEFNKKYNPSDIKVNPDNTIEIKQRDTSVLVGESLMSKEDFNKELDHGNGESLLKKDPTVLGNIYSTFRESNDIYSRQSTNSINEEVSESENLLKVKLLNNISKLGIKTMAISEYIDKYSIRNGVEPSVKALADIANGIIALSKNANIKDIAEELGHFIVEGYNNQKEIEALLNEVENTQEWLQYNDQYYKAYGLNYKGEELDRVVRREVLGKVVANNLVKESTKDNGIINKIRNIIQTFKDYLSQFINSKLTNDIKKLVDTITEKTLNDSLDDIIDSSKFINNTYKYYSLEDKKTITRLLQAKQTMEIQLASLKKAKDTDATKVSNDLDKLNLALNKNDEQLALTTILASVKGQYNNLSKIINKLKRGDNEVKFLTPEELSQFRVLSDEYIPILEGVLPLLKEGYIADNVNTKNHYVNTITDIINGISNLRGDIKHYGHLGTEKVAEEIIDRYSLSKERKADLINYIKGEKKDINWLQKVFGTLEHATNYYLNMLGVIISDNYTNANNALIRRIKPFLKEAEDLKWNIEDSQSILEKIDGKITGYTESPFLMGKFEQAKKQANVDAYNFALGTTLTLEDYEKGNSYKLSRKKVKPLSEFTIEERRKYNEFINSWREENTERKYTNDFYKEVESKYKDLEISDVTRDFLRNLSTQRSMILKKVGKKGQRVDLFKDLSSSDRVKLESLYRVRRQAKSYYDSDTGEKKVGDDLIIAEDLNKLDDSYVHTDKKISDGFLKSLREIEDKYGNETALEWLKANGGIVFNETFWDELKADSNPLVDRLKELENEYKSLGTKDKLYKELVVTRENLERLSEARKEIIKQYQRPNSPSEIDASSMTTSTLLTIRNIENEYLNVLNEAKSWLKQAGKDVEYNKNKIYESGVNDSYYEMLEASNKDELSFIEEHILDHDRIQLNTLKGDLYNFKNSSIISTNLRRVLSNMYFNGEEVDDFTYEDIINENGEDNILITYGKSKLLPYFRRFSPNNYDTLYQNLKKGIISTTDIIEKILDPKSKEEPLFKYLDIRANFNWLDDVEDSKYLNKNYIQNFEGPEQPKVDKYLNNEFFNKYKVDKELYLTTGQLSSKNKNKKFEMLEKLWEMKREALQLYNETYNESVFKVPQLSKGAFERIGNLISTNPLTPIQETLKDLTYNRIDDLDYGARVDGEDVELKTNIRMIPKYYLRNLENTEDIATDLVKTYSILMKGAFEYQERLNSISKVMALEQTILDDSYLGEDRQGVSNTYQMFKSYMDRYFYGIKRNQYFVNIMGKKVDVSKLTTSINSFVRKHNLVFSLPIAATSLTSSLVFMKIESLVGEHMNKDSLKWATQEFTKLTPDFFKETGKIHKTNKLSLLAERMRLKHVDENVHSAGYNRFLRVVDTLPFKFLELSGYPIYMRIMLSTLDDFRLVDGRIMTFNEFKDNYEKDYTSDKEIKEKWDTYRGKSVYNLLEDRKGVIEFKKEAIKECGKEYLEAQLNRIITKVKRVNGNIDSIVSEDDKAMASRNFLLDTVLTHRNWLTQVAQRKFKKRHFNFAIGQFEEGHYVTLARFIKSVMNTAKEDNFKQVVKAIKENYRLMTKEEQRNVTRSLYEWGIYMGLIALKLVLSSGDDDDDKDKIWMNEFASYIYLRTVSEVGSNQLPTGIYGGLEAVQQPFMFIRSIKDFLSFQDWDTEEVESGQYEGHSKLYRKLVKQTALRHYYEVKDAETIRQKADAYKKLNYETLLWLAKTKKEDDE